MADSNPANFANVPKDELREIAAKGGHASHGIESHPDRNPDGTFTQGSHLAQELGSKGGHVAHEHQVEKDGRNADGTFKEGSKLAQELGEKGGHAGHEK
ncbi:hypothetical protein P280DRAFT_398773 [Massarina eburnea CBS 473.64]|uniref:Conidiation-specific protein 10 n=1 Tax=Massarina eburnea CBS 473.64 TaxID=1395130 RepID=A0A6A6S3J2_9PLEO|nr:hypothetical protein P280DRAFT_398773 [Massarina eburnea CBS 473.64]